MFKIKEMLDFAHVVRRKFAEKIATLPWDEVTANREASHYSMKNILVHMVDNEDWILDAHIKGNQSHVRRRPDEFQTMDSIMGFMAGVEERTNEYLGSAGEDQLQRRVTVTFSSGAKETMTAEEWLMQSFTEQLFHLGEIEALLWQRDVEPPRMQWFANNPRAAR